MGKQPQRKRATPPTTRWSATQLEQLAESLIERGLATRVILSRSVTSDTRHFTERADS